MSLGSSGAQRQGSSPRCRQARAGNGGPDEPSATRIKLSGNSAVLRSSDREPAAHRDQRCIGTIDGSNHRRFRKFGTQTGNELVPLSYPDRPVFGDWRRIETAGVIEDSALFGETGGRAGGARGERQRTADEVAPRRSDVTHGIPQRPTKNSSVQKVRSDARPVISNRK